MVAFSIYLTSHTTMSGLRRAAALYDSEQYAAALPLLQAAQRLSEQKPGGRSSPETATIFHFIGGCYNAMSDFRAAAEHYRRAAAITSSPFMDRIKSSLNAAKSFSNSDNFAEAETQNNVSLAMLAAESAAGTTAPASLKRYRADVLSLSAGGLKQSGRYSETLSLYEESLSYYESSGDTERVISCLTGLGEVYIQQGLPEKALTMARRAQPLNPRTGLTLAELGRLWTELERYDEALVCFQKALVFEERDSGKNSLYSATIQVYIGNVYDSRGQLDVALSWFQRARATYEKHNSTGTINFGALSMNTGACYGKVGNFSEALALFTRALAIFRKEFPPDHPSVAACMNYIAIANYELGNSDASAAAGQAATAAARRSQVQCAAAGCPRKLKADGTPLDQCGGCKRCYYCSKVCQTADWKAGHKVECKELRK